MKVIELRIEEWQADVLAAAAAGHHLSCEEFLREIVYERASREVDSVCRRLFDDAEDSCRIEIRLMDLFHR